MRIEEWLNNDKLGIDIWNKKYRYENESFDEWLNRISNGNEKVKRLIIEKKFLFGGRILANRGLQNKGKKITYSNCFTPDTEIMTKDGIKSLEECLNKDIEVLAKGAWRKATVKDFGVQNIVSLSLHKKHSKKTLNVTKDHIWYVKNANGCAIEKKTMDLVAGDKLMSDIMKCYKIYKPSPFGVAHGFFYGDGSHTGECRKANFCGDKQELIKYFTPDTFGESNGVVTISSIPKIFWGKPSLDETKSYLYGWLAGYFAADGSIDDRGSCVICSSKEEDLKFVQDVLCVLGIPCEEIRKQTRMSNLTNTISDVFILTLNKCFLNESFFVLSKHKEKFLSHPAVNNDFNWIVDDIVDNNLTSTVMCVVENDTHSFTLKNGILTHNCYVTEVDDSIEDIFDAAKRIARTYSYGGGIGLDLSNLSPRGAMVNNAAKTSTGAVSFMDLYSTVTGLIGQNNRRGALMLSISCDHPDIEEFIDCKNDLSKVNFANISVRVTDKFMKAVENDEEFKLSFTRKETGEHIEKTVKAKDLFRKIAENNWKTGEPGILFWDRIENYNLLSEYDNFHYAGINPCARL